MRSRAEQKVHSNCTGAKAVGRFIRLALLGLDSMHSSAMLLLIQCKARRFKGMAAQRSGLFRVRDIRLA